jgi:hypothetical protein
MNPEGVFQLSLFILADLPPLVRSKSYIGHRAEGGQNEGQEVFCGTGRFEASRS